MSEKRPKVHEALWEMGDEMGLKWFISDKVENMGLWLFICTYLIMSQTVRLLTVSLIEIPPHVKDWKLMLQDEHNSDTWTTGPIVWTGGIRLN